VIEFTLDWLLLRTTSK